MKTSLAVTLTPILGIAAGLGIAALRMEITPWDGNPGGAGADPQMPVVARAGEPMPKLVLDQKEYNFGTLDIDDEGSHDFVFTNAGETTLLLKGGPTSCRCTGTKIERDQIPPGESAKVTVTFAADEKPGPYRETAKIRTNDPRQREVTLIITGRITVTVRAVPSELVFSRLSVDESATGQFRLLCYLDEPLEVLGHKWANQEISEHFDVTFEPLSSDQRDEETGLGNEENLGGSANSGEKEKVQSGYLAEVTVKPGLPLGTFRQTILIETNLEAAPTVTVPVTGTVGSEISIVGRGWDDRAGVLSLGTVSSQEGAQRQLILLVHGPHRKEVDFRLVHSVPDLLKVKPGETTPIGEGLVTQTLLIIQIPTGSRPANHLGSRQGRLGEILIETNHPQVPQLRIRVSFAVEG